jgi:Domain of unknown function (DUF4177)
VSPSATAIVSIAEAMPAARAVVGRMSGQKSQDLLNEHARNGSRLKAFTWTDVKGRIGPGSVEGMLSTFERVE